MKKKNKYAQYGYGTCPVCHELVPVTRSKKVIYIHNYKRIRRNGKLVSIKGCKGHGMQALDFVPPRSPTRLTLDQIWRKRYYNRGLCQRCQSRPSVRGGRCEKCLALHKKYCVTYKKRIIARGRCVRCLHKLDEVSKMSGKLTCIECSNKRYFFK